MSQPRIHRSVSNRNECQESPLPRARSQERSVRCEPRDFERLHLPSGNDDRRVSNNNGSEHGTKSKAAAPSRPFRLERSNSDPFDTATADANPRRRTESNGQQVLPTLPRFPVTDAHDLNCWSEPSVDIFKVRGPNYFRDKKKLQSGPFLLNARGVDLLLTDKPSQSISGTRGILGGQLQNMPTFMINLRFPWGLLVLYFEIPEKFCPFLHASPTPNGGDAPSMDGMTASEQTFCKFLLGDDAHKNNCLKLIPYVVEGPWAARTLVTGKPAIIGKKLPVKYFENLATKDKVKAAPCLEGVLDIGSGSRTAKRIVSVCRRYMNCITFDLGFVIQGNTPEELPEQMLGAIRIHGLEPLLAPTLATSTT